MPNITVEQLKDGLRTLRKDGAIMLTIEAVGGVQLKGGSPWKNGDISKRYRANFMLGIDWEKFKQAQQERAGETPNYVAGPHPWAKYVDSCFVQNKEGTREYLRLVQTKRLWEQFSDGGEPIEAAAIVPWIRESNSEYRNVPLDGIISITYGGIDYSIIQE